MRDEEATERIAGIVEGGGHTVCGRVTSSEPDGGAKAVAECKRTRPDVVVLHLLMGGSGIKTTATMAKLAEENEWERRPRVILVAPPDIAARDVGWLEGQSKKDIMELAVKGGANGFITAPIEETELLTVISEAGPTDG